MRAPRFWRHDGWLARLLSPLGALHAAATAARVARPGWVAPAPVICCGNATAGGAGKTTLALDLADRLTARGRRVAFLTRGYGGRETGRVAGHDAARFGDEALLLAAAAPTWAGADRAASARAALAEGADVLVLDDGLQNPSLAKTLSFLVIDGAQGFGNGRVIPAGPLREPVAAAAQRSAAAVLIGEDRTGALALLPPALPVLRARLCATRPIPAGPLLAFAGIGRPEKFATTLREAGATLAALRGFPDHHRFRPRELASLRREAASLGARLVTTPKDAVRLPAAFRAEVAVVGVALDWADPDALERLLAGAVA